MRVSFRQNLLAEKGRFAVERKRFSVEQIMAVLKQAELDVRALNSSVECQAHTLLISLCIFESSNDSL
jgi:hypothetical protein